MALTHRAFVDESGQRDYGPSTDRYFAVGGVIAELADANDLRLELAGLKRAHFGDPGVEIKSNWIRQPKERQAHYLDKYVITMREIDAFVAALYAWLKASPLVLIAGVVD